MIAHAYNVPVHEACHPTKYQSLGLWKLRKCKTMQGAKNVCIESNIINNIKRKVESSEYHANK